MEQGKVNITAFDLDGTLLDGQSGTLVLKYLISHRLVGLKACAGAAWWGIRYRFHLPHRQDEVRQIIFRRLRHLPAEEIHELMKNFHDEVMIPRYRRDGIAEIRRRQGMGDHVVVVSATFDEIAQVAREYLGVDCALATKMERDEDGLYTGNVLGAVTEGQEKVNRIRKYADDTFGSGAWRLSCAYGDHYTDAPLLEAAGECRVVDPGPAMRRQAARHGWPRVEWR